MKDEKIQCRVFFGGDQLTVERCRSAQNAKIQSINPKK